MQGKIVRSDFEIYAKGIKRLEELEKEVNLLNVDKKFPSETASIRSKLKHVSEIPQIEYEIKLLKEKISGKIKKQSRQNSATEDKINNLKEEIKKKSRESKKFAPLSKEVVRLKLEIAAMQKKIRAHEGEKKRKNNILKNINVGVDKVFDDTFNLSLNDIKAKLSREVENKEAVVQRELQNDLVRREEIFNEKYNELEKEFNKKYNEKVKKELEKEVKQKFNNLLRTEINKKNKLSEEELSNLKSKLKLEFEAKEKALRGHFDKDILDEKKMIRDHFEDELLSQKVKLHKKLDFEIAKEVLRLKQKEGEKEHALSEKVKSLSKLKEKLSENLAKAKDSMQLEEEEKLKQRISQIEKEKKRFNSSKDKILSNARNKLEDERKQFENQKRREMQKIMDKEEAFRKKAEEIKNRLQKEYDQKLKDGIKAKQDEFKSKNVALEKEIQKKVKMFYK
jgi:hypothetical protein